MATSTKTQSPLKNFRCPDSLWNQAKTLAHDEGMSLGELLRDLLRDYVAGKRMS